MKSKRKEIKKYNVGGYLQAGLGAAQTLYGMTQMPRARAEFERAQAAAPSLETPAQYYENYKNAYDSELARMQNEAIQANLAASVSALQSAGGRALVGGLGAATAGADRQRQAMLAQERALRMQAGQQLAGAQERQIQREEARSQRDIGMASQAYQAALGNVAGGLGSIGTGLLYAGMQGAGKKTPPPTFTPTDQLNGLEVVDNIDLSEIAASTQPDAADAFSGITEEVKAGNTMLSEAWADQWFKNTYGSKEGKQLNISEAPKPPSFNISDYPAPQFPSSGYNAPTSEPQGQIEAVSGIVADRLYSRMEDSIERSMPKKDFDESMLGPDQFYQIFGDTVFIRNMSPQQLREREFFRKAGKIGQNTLTGSGMQSVVGNLKEQGGMMTSGEFNHSTNKVHLVQDGKKIGEATGQEVILNPEQAKKIANESTYARKLFKFFAKQANKNKR
jgi:hypothetical protein